jgi:NitT/TauT family transport system substrate-binding protein
LLSTAAGAAVSIGFPAIVRAQGLTTVRVGLALEDDATPVLYGVQSGLFKKAGLDVQVQSVPSGAAGAAAVAGGALDIGKSSMISLVSAHVHGLPFSLIAASGVYTSEAPIAALLVPKTSPIKTGADFAGKTISAASLQDLAAVATEAWIDMHGGSASSLRVLELPSSAVAAALEQGTIDGATVVDPALAEALDGGKMNVLGHSFSAIADRFLIAAFFCTNDYIAKNGDTIRRFNAALHDAVVYTNAHHGETLPLIAAWSKIPPATLARMTRSTSGAVLDPAEIQPLIAAAAKYKVIAKTYPAQELIAKL